MRYSWRWYGPNDLVKISDVAQTGANEVVTALHSIPNGEVWSVEAIQQRKKEVEWDTVNKRPTNLKWTIVESVPVHDHIKKRIGNYKSYIENYKKTLGNLGKCGISTVIYNFMPVLDWTRTDLQYELPDGSKALNFDEDVFAAFELFILKREGAEKEYSIDQVKKAESIYKSMNFEKIEILTRTIIAGLPGAEESFTLDEFSEVLKGYDSISADDLRNNLAYFIKEIIPTAEKAEVKMAIHPDDPPRPILGLPRVMSNINDVEYLLNSVPSNSNGLNLCAGSFGVNTDNDLVEMMRKFGDRVHFVHLRSVKRTGKSFLEDNHLEGSVDLFSLVKAVLEEESSRKKAGIGELEIPMRPDHGHQMLDDLNKKTNPGYSCIGRMKGLAEIKGMVLAIKRMMK
ncbi:MAG: mannonate dehydratase [bacterium]|nr:mannonate dehydratase [bacterium]